MQVKQNLYPIYLFSIKNLKSNSRIDKHLNKTRTLGRVWGIHADT